MDVTYNELIKEFSTKDSYSEEMLDVGIDEAAKSLETAINNSEFMSYYLTISTESLYDKINMYKRIGKVYNLDATRSIESTISNGIKKFINAITSFISTMINMIKSFFTYISENIFKLMKHFLIESGNIKEIDEEKRNSLISSSISNNSVEVRLLENKYNEIQEHVRKLLTNCVTKCGNYDKITTIPIYNILNIADKDEVWINNMFRYSKFIENYFENYLENDINMISREVNLMKELLDNRNVEENVKKLNELINNPIGGNFKDLYSQYNVERIELQPRKILNSYLKNLKLVNIKEYNFRLHKYINEIESSLRKNLKASLRSLDGVRTVLKTSLKSDGLQKYDLDFRRTTNKFYEIHKNTNDSLLAIKCIGFCVCGRLRIRNIILRNIEK